MVNLATRPPSSRSKSPRQTEFATVMLAAQHRVPSNQSNAVHDEGIRYISVSPSLERGPLDGAKTRNGHPATRIGRAITTLTKTRQPGRDWWMEVVAPPIRAVRYLILK
jgi:hypothetical protein